MPKKKSSHGASGAVLGLAALAAAAAGAYFLYGKDAPKRRAQVKGWALRAKGEVLEAIEKVPGVLNEKKYRAVVDQVTRRYRSLKQTSPAEVDALGRELKSHWRSIQKHLTAAGSDVVRSASRIKKTVRKGTAAKRRR